MGNIILCTRRTLVAKQTRVEWATRNWKPRKLLFFQTERIVPGVQLLLSGSIVQWSPWTERQKLCTYSQGSITHQGIGIWTNQSVWTHWKAQWRNCVLKSAWRVSIRTTAWEEPVLQGCTKLVLKNRSSQKSVVTGAIVCDGTKQQTLPRSVMQVVHWWPFVQRKTMETMTWIIDLCWKNLVMVFWLS